MGNARARELRDDYTDQAYTEVVCHNDQNMGSYRILKFRRENRTLFLSKTLNPAEYDKYSSDVDEFSKKLMRHHQNICEFFFVEVNQRSAETYDLVFEFGDYINTNFQSEKVIWTFIEHILAGLLFLQNEGFHYPIVRKKYTVYQSDRNSFKLLNPFCFPQFLDKVIGLYLNPNIGVSEKKAFQNQSLIRNIKEFGIMILALIKNQEENFFFKNPSSIRQSLSAFKRENVYSDKLINFLIFTIENRSPMTFLDLKRFISADISPASSDQFQNSYFMNPMQFYHNINQTLLNSLPSSGSHSNEGYNFRNASSEHELQVPALKNYSSFQSSPTLQVSDFSKPAPSFPSKKIKRIVVRWVPELSSQKEFYEFEDGTFEEKQAPGREKAPSQLESHHDTAPDQKKSLMGHYDIRPISGRETTKAADTSTWNVILYSDTNLEPAKLILTANIRNKYNSYENMKSVVNSSDPLKPSIYHAVEDAGPVAPPRPAYQQPQPQPQPTQPTRSIQSTHSIQPAQPTQIQSSQSQSSHTSESYSRPVEQVKVTSASNLYSVPPTQTAYSSRSYVQPSQPYQPSYQPSQQYTPSTNVQQYSTQQYSSMPQYSAPPSNSSVTKNGQVYPTYSYDQHSSPTNSGSIQPRTYSQGQPYQVSQPQYVSAYQGTPTNSGNGPQTYNFRKTNS